MTTGKGHRLVSRLVGQLKQLTWVEEDSTLPIPLVSSLVATLVWDIIPFGGQADIYAEGPRQNSSRGGGSFRSKLVYSAPLTSPFLIGAFNRALFPATPR